MDGRSVDGGASSVGGGPTGNRVGSRSDLVRTAQHLLYAGAASLTRRPMRAVLVELGRDVRHLFYCSGLKGSTTLHLANPVQNLLYVATEFLPAHSCSSNKNAGNRVTE